MTQMTYRDPTDAELTEMAERLHAFAWEFACRFAGIDEHTPRPAHNPNLAEDERRAAALASLNALHAITEVTGRIERASALLAGHYGASYPQLGAAWGGMSKQGARRRWRTAVPVRIPSVEQTPLRRALTPLVQALFVNPEPLDPRLRAAGDGVAHAMHPDAPPEDLVPAIQALLDAAPLLPASDTYTTAAFQHLAEVVADYRAVGVAFGDID